MADTHEIRFSDEVMPPHRAIRRLPYEGRLLFQGLVLALLADALMAFFLDDLWRVYAFLVQSLLSRAGVPFERALITHAAFLFPCFQVSTFLPTPAFLAVCAAVLGLLAYVQWLTKWIPHPLWSALVLVSVVVACSCLYFYFWGTTFPYSTFDFSRMWLASETFIWFLTPFIFALTYFTLPLTLSQRVFWPVVALAFLFLSAAVRQALFLAILHAAGVFWMPVLLIFFGLLLDFAFLIGIYSLGVNVAAYDLGRHWRVWK